MKMRHKSLFFSRFHVSSFRFWNITPSPLPLNVGNDYELEERDCSLVRKYLVT